MFDEKVIKSLQAPEKPRGIGGKSFRRLLSLRSNKLCEAVKRLDRYAVFIDVTSQQALDVRLLDDCEQRSEECRVKGRFGGSQKAVPSYGAKCALRM